MTISVFDLFSIGIGPSSSHTVGPMRAANTFISILANNKKLADVKRIQIELFGSLAFTGKGHGTDKAILSGLEGNMPDTVDPEVLKTRAQTIIESESIRLNNQIDIPFHYLTDMIYNFKDVLPAHTNGMRFKAFDKNQQEMSSEIYYSIGGGFIFNEEEAAHSNKTMSDFPYPFSTAKELLNQCEKNNLSISELMMKNESSLRPLAEVKERLLKIAAVMEDCISAGCNTPGILPGGLDVKRRAHYLHEKLMAKGKPQSVDHNSDSMEWLNLFAIAVNEVNAAGGRVVTAPTNGAAGIIPAVLHYYLTVSPA